MWEDRWNGIGAGDHDEGYRLDLTSGKLEQLTQGLGHVTLFDLSPNAKELLLQVDEDRHTGRGWIGVLNLKSKQVRRCWDNGVPLRRLSW